MACRICRSRKVKCDRTRPSCKNCMLRGNECIYTGERRKRRLRKRDDAQSQDSNEIPFSGEWNMNMTPPRPATLDFHPTRVTERGNAITASVPSSSTDSVRTRTPAVETTTAHPGQAGLLDDILDGDDVDPLKDCHPAIWMRVEDAEEYTGPSTGIAAISDLGLKWICSQVPDSDELCHTIQYVRKGLLVHLRQCIPPQPSPNPEMAAVWKPLPPPETVREYVDAYFSTVQTIFPVVDPDVFDGMLAQWYQQQPACQSDSWKALLNAVLASGCRAALSNGTASGFKASSNASWGFFQNALNYEPKLVHSATDLLSVQALVAMVVFAQGMSCSQRLEYILCSTAARLAHSLALNRRVPKYWHMSEQEQRERYRLFWVIYCLDKGIALRSGRPPVIHDEDISCPFPRDVLYGEEPRFDFFYYLTKFYRICSLIAQRLYSTPALCRPTSELRMAADEILARLELWCESIPAQLRPGQPFSGLPLSCGRLRTQAIVLHSCYYYAICAVHRRFTPIFSLGNEQGKPEESAVVYIEAARSMALLTRHLDIESYIPAWWDTQFIQLHTLLLTLIQAPVLLSSNSTRNDFHAHGDNSIVDIRIQRYCIDGIRGWLFRPS